MAPATIGGQLEGSVTVDDLETSKARAVRARAALRRALPEPLDAAVGYLPRRVWEEVAFGPRNLSLPLGEVVDRVDAALGALGITDLQERDPQRLSGGQAQLVALASVLALRPRYLVLDEPTSQLDPEGTRLVGDALAAGGARDRRRDPARRAQGGPAGRARRARSWCWPAAGGHARRPGRRPRAIRA